MDNTAQVDSSPVADPDASNDAATDSDTLTAAADLAITKTDSADPVIAGEDLTYTLVVTNDGPSDATNVVVTDDVPAGTSFVSADGGGIEAAGTVTWNLGTIADGASATVHVTVHVNEARTADLSNTAGVASDQGDPDPSDDEATEPTTVDEAADLSITKDADATALVGADITYTIVVTNDGPSDATDVVVSDALPAGVTYGLATATQGSCAETAGTVTCDLGSIADGASATITLIVNATTAGVMDNTASVSSDVPDPDPSDDDDSASTTVTAAPVVADLEVVKTASSDPVYVGDELTYTIVVTNLGPDAADDVTVTDPLDADVRFVSADHGGIETGGVVTWDLGQVADGEVVTLALVVEILAPHEDLSNTATSASSTPDADPSNDAGTAIVDAWSRSVLTADLQVDKSVDLDRPAVGDVVTYTVVVTNHGPADATNVRVRDELPVGLQYRASSASVGAYDPTTSVWHVGALPNGASATLTMDVRITGAAAQAHSVENVASVAGLDETDPDDTNDADEREITVVLGGGDGNGNDGDDDAQGTGGTAFTGANIARSLALLLGFVAAGFVFLVAARRRRTGDEHASPDAG